MCHPCSEAIILRVLFEAEQPIRWARNKRWLRCLISRGPLDNAAVCSVPERGSPPPAGLLISLRLIALRTPEAYTPWTGGSQMCTEQHEQRMATSSLFTEWIGLRASDEDHHRKHGEREGRRRTQRKRTYHYFIPFPAGAQKKKPLPLMAPDLSAPRSRPPSCIWGPCLSGRWWSNHLMRAQNKGRLILSVRHLTEEWQKMYSVVFTEVPER